ncbi:MAG: M28 family peptidase [Chitinophagales bacterium]|nr:M28 family peptidase [Chitinophagales bacterium]
MKLSYYIIAIGLVCLHACSGCGNGNGPQPIDNTNGTSDTNTIVDVTVPDFVEDTAYQFVAKQVAFGPRVPNTPQHEACSQWLQQTMKALADTVYTQQVPVTAFNGKVLNCTNIIGAFNPNNPNRILLVAHWDSRPWADQDADASNHDKPILGANDGASGVGVLLEVARILKANKVNIGVDLLLVDVEDYGKPGYENSYGLGSQYWAKNPHKSGYQAKFGILLDMVGAPNSTFLLEANSMQYAPDVLQKIWPLAIAKGYGQYFQMIPGPAIDDDHVYINRYAGIKMVDIIHLSASSQSVFHPSWHTMQDNMQVIDKSTLNAVGQTLLEVIYREDKAVL